MPGARNEHHQAKNPFPCKACKAVSKYSLVIDKDGGGLDCNRDDSISDILKSRCGESGVSIYELDIKKIKPSHAVRLKCMVPLCEYYNVCKVCPPHIPGVDEFKGALKDFNKAFLVVLREQISNLEEYRTDFKAEMKLAEIVANLELTAFQHGYYQALGLCVGGCKLCPECAPVDQPCRHPFKARPSPEGFGIDISKLAREAGVPVEWPPVEYVSFLGLLLI